MSIYKEIRPRSANFSLEYFVEQCREESVLSYNQAFELRVLTVDFKKPRGSFETHDGAVRRIEQKFDKDYRKVLEKIEASLPQGIMIQIEKWPAREAPYSSLLSYSVCLSVSADYSKKAFESMAVGNIVHLSPLDPTFLQEATAFEEKLLSSRKETVEEIGSFLLKHDGIVITKELMFGAFKPRTSDADIYSFSGWGLKNLATLAQCYGLAMALIDQSNGTRRGKIRLNKESGQVEIETRLRPEEKKQKQLQEW